MTSPSLYQPSPRFGHCAAQIGEKAYLWGGRTQNFSTSGRKTHQSEIEIFGIFYETWSKKNVNGAAPPGLLAGACTVVSETLYHFGGHDGHSRYNTLHSLDTVTLDWRALYCHTQNPADQPMLKSGCGLVTYSDATSLILFAGYGVPHGPTQPGSRFVQNTNFTDGRGWTNELHLFNLTNGEWTSPPTAGPRPPPCAWFSFTAINHHMAVMFGGLHCVQGGRRRVNDVYIIDFHSMVWTKLERPEGATWPVERSYHAATCLNYGDDHPQLLVTGGLDKMNKTISHAWLLDINTGRWRELTLPEGTQPRWGHTLTACSVCPGRVYATTFGGVPECQFGKTDNAKEKLAETTVMEFESVQSGVSSPTSEWVLVGTITTSELGTPERVTQLEKMKQRKTDHAHLRGAEVVAETTFTLTPEQQSFEFTGYGFKLHVPEDSLPAEVSETQLNVRVSLSGQFQLPTNCELVSAVYWVYSPHKFTKALVVEIQHCAPLSNDEQCEQLTFVRTMCTQKELPYTFTEEGGVFSYHSSYGSLSLTHFSGVGVAHRRGCKVHRPHRARPAPYRVQPVLSASEGTIQVQPQQPASYHSTDTVPSELSLDSQQNIESSKQDKEIFDQYCGQVYIKRGVNDCRVYFVITRNLDAHRTVVREFYSTKMQAKEDIEMALEFGEDNCISLAIPRSGIVLQSGWKIIPRYNPMIKKANVDHFSCGQMIPKCELLLRWPHREKPLVCLEHDIELTGAKGCSYFTLYVPDEDTPIPSPVTIDGGLVSPSSTVSPPRDLSIKYAGLESEPELSDLMNEVASKVPAKWKQISIQLELTPSDQECFMASTPNDPLQCFTSVFRVWKSRATKLYKWSTVIEALELPAVDEMRLAQELRTKLQS